MENDACGLNDFAKKKKMISSIGVDDITYLVLTIKFFFAKQGHVSPIRIGDIILGIFWSWSYKKYVLWNNGLYHIMGMYLKCI